MTQDTHGKVTTSHLDIKNESQEVNPYVQSQNAKPFYEED